LTLLNYIDIYYYMLVVKVNGKLEEAIKTYRSKIIKTRQMSELNERKEFKKGSVQKREDKSKGIYKEKKKRENN